MTVQDALDTCKVIFIITHPRICPNMAPFFEAYSSSYVATDFAVIINVARAGLIIIIYFFDLTEAPLGYNRSGSYTET